MNDEQPQVAPLQTAPGALAPEGARVPAALTIAADAAAEAEVVDPADAIPIPPAWKPMKDWLTAPAPAFAGDQHAVQFWLQDLSGITHRGLLYYRAPRNAGHFSYHSFYGTGYVIPNYPWVNRYEQVNGAYDQLPAQWVRIIINVRLNAAGAQGGTSGLTYLTSTNDGVFPGAAVGDVEVDSPQLLGGPTRFVTGLDRSVLYLDLTTTLV